MALSSGEAELHGMLKGATLTMELVSVMADFGEKVVATMFSDASAAIGKAHLQGFGKMRIVKKVGTNNKPPYFLTNALNGDPDQDV